MMKIDHRALLQPDRSSLRKMSPKTLNSSQIHMTNKKNHSIDQKTWPVPNSAASMVCYLRGLSVVGLGLEGVARPGVGGAGGLGDGGPPQVEALDRVGDHRSHQRLDRKSTRLNSSH